MEEFPKKGRLARSKRVPATGGVGHLAVSAAGRANQRGQIITAGSPTLGSVSHKDRISDALHARDPLPNRKFVHQTSVQVIRSVRGHLGAGATRTASRRGSRRAPSTGGRRNSTLARDRGRVRAARQDCANLSIHG